MIDLNIHIATWGDRDQLAECVDTARGVLPDVHIHVFDGRYASFKGATSLTPGLREWCAYRANLTYHEPEHHRLPFGHASQAPAKIRSGVADKARWMIEETLPQNEWTLKLDTDDRLLGFDRAALAEIRPSSKVAVPVDIVGDREAWPTRLFQPKWWTTWIDDCLLPRGRVGRHVPISRRYRAWNGRLVNRFISYQQCDDIAAIKNVGLSRPEEYQQRRIAQLERLGRDDRARDLAALAEGRPEDGAPPNA